MIKEFIKKCLNKAKEEYFNTDHHNYGGEQAKDAEWKGILTFMNRDFYDEWIDPVICEMDEDLWNVSNKFMLYMLCKDVAKGELQ